MTTLLDTLTDEQLAAATATGPRVRVEAGPGSGKSRVVAGRVVHLVEDRGVDPASILILTFTRAATTEIRRRIADAIGPCPVHAQTFHGFGTEVLVGEPSLGEAMEIETYVAMFMARTAVTPLRRTPRVATEAEADAALRSLYPPSPMQRRPRRSVPGIRAVQAGIVRYETTGAKGGRGVDGPGVVEDAVDLVEHRLREARLIPTWALVPQALAAVRRGRVRSYAHVLVDEDQDVSPAEGDLARELVGTGGSLFSVGDPRQGIFTWRGAVGMTDPAEVLALTRTFRFGEAIAAEANAIAARFGGAPIVGGDVPGGVVRAPWADVRAIVADAPADTLVLARTNRRCVQLLQELAGIAELVRREPMGDPLESVADRFEAVWARGRAAVSTIHGAKGREAERVVLLDEDPECRPAWEGGADPEELRVRYVATTRARRLLVLLAAPEVEGAGVDAEREAEAVHV